MTGTYLDHIETRYGNEYAADLRTLAFRYAKDGISILEFGSGTSTKIFAELADTCKGWLLSLDHVKDYLSGVAASIDSQRVDFRHFDLTGPCESQSDAELNYSSYPLALNKKFDLMFVDGRRRVECALTCALLAHPDSVVITHDHARLRYGAMSELFEQSEEFSQFRIFRKSRLTRRVPPPSKARVAIIQVVGGDFALEEHGITRESVESYCRRIGAAHEVVRFDDVPAAALKFLARSHFDAYDRVCLLDTDVVIRPSAPNIFDVVPPNMIGAWRQDRLFVDSSRALNHEFRNYYGDARAPQNAFINSGVLVVPSLHYALLDVPKTIEFLGHPLHENSYVSNKIFDEGRPFFNLPYDFNFIPHSDHFLDCRFGFFVHLAGAGKAKSQSVQGWEVDGHAAGIRWLRRTTVAARHTRLARLRALARTAQGVVTSAFDVTDFYIKAPSRILIEHGRAVASIVPGDYPYDLPVFGPYSPLPPGKYRLQLDGLVADSCAVYGDVYYTAGGQVIQQQFELRLGDWFEFQVALPTEDFQVRINTPSSPVSFEGILVERLLGNAIQKP